MVGPLPNYHSLKNLEETYLYGRMLYRATKTHSLSFHIFHLHRLRESEVLIQDIVTQYTRTSLLCRCRSPRPPIIVCYSSKMTVDIRMGGCICSLTYFELFERRKGTLGGLLGVGSPRYTKWCQLSLLLQSNSHENHDAYDLPRLPINFRVRLPS